jgi:cysteine/O-acetylserine efflux protein
MVQRVHRLIKKVDMDIQVLPVVVFVIVTTFTPGPNNISSASLGVMFGYRKALPYLLGITAGFLAVMLGCAYLASALLAVLPQAAQYLRWIGAIYIFWLAVGVLRANYAGDTNGPTSHAFARGFVLQLFNPKVAVYGLTLYSTFLAALSSRPLCLALLAVVFALTAFAATSAWALCGAAVRNHLRSDALRLKINLLLALLLVYTAIDLAGLLD